MDALAALRRAVWFLNPHQGNEPMKRSQALSAELDLLVSDLQETSVDLRNYAQRYRKQIKSGDTADD